MFHSEQEQVAHIEGGEYLRAYLEEAAKPKTGVEHCVPGSKKNKFHYSEDQGECLICGTRVGETQWYVHFLIERREEEGAR